MSTNYQERRTTVGALRRMLAPYGDNCEITFGSTLAARPLEFHRLKARSDDGTLVQIELNEAPPAAVELNGAVRST